MGWRAGIVFFFFALVLTGATAAIAQSATTAGLPTKERSNGEEEVRALGLKLADLIVRGDWDEYEKYLTSDYSRVTTDGKLETKEEAMAGFRQGPRKVIVMEPEELRVRIYRDTAVLVARTSLSVRETGRLTQRVERTTQVFVNRDGQWRLATEQETYIGKP